MRWLPRRRHACKRFDFSWADWRHAIRACLAPPSWGEARAQAERAFSPAGDAIACISARSGFDLFLRVAGAKWRPGAEIIFTALTIPDMPALARRHRFRPVPLDVDPLTAEWDAAALSRLVTPRTRAVVVAHLFGARVDLTATLAEAQRLGLSVIEDCAQAYAGPHWRGHPAADVSLFSFGPLKTATALGGAFARVRDAATRRAMRAIAGRAPVQPTGEYLRRLFRYGLLQAGSAPRAYGAITALADKLRVPARAWAENATRSLPEGSEPAALRRRPSAANLALLARRLGEGMAPVARRQPPAQVLLDALGPQAPLPTRHAAPHGHWLVPALCDDAEALRAALAAEGFDAQTARLAPVAGDFPTPGADRLARAVCLPFDPRMADGELERLGALARPWLAGG